MTYEKKQHKNVQNYRSTTLLNFNSCHAHEKREISCFFVSPRLKRHVGQVWRNQIICTAFFFSMCITLYGKTNLWSRGRTPSSSPSSGIARGALWSPGRWCCSEGCNIPATTLHQLASCNCLFRCPWASVFPLHTYCDRDEVKQIIMMTSLNIYRALGRKNFHFHPPERCAVIKIDEQRLTLNDHFRQCWRICQCKQQ